MSEVQVLKCFKENLLAFFDELIENFPREGDLIIMRIFINDQIPIKEVMKIFVQRLLKDDGKIRKMGEERNDQFFLEHDIFEEISQGKAKHFKKMWTSEHVTDEDKETIWAWIERFLLIADRYMNVTTEPFSSS